MFRPITDRLSAPAVGLLVTASAAGLLVAAPGLAVALAAPALGPAVVAPERTPLKAAPAANSSVSWSGWLVTVKRTRIPRTVVAFRSRAGRITNFTVRGVLLACRVPGTHRNKVKAVTVMIPSVRVKNGHFATTYQFGKHRGDAYSTVSGTLQGLRSRGSVREYTKAGPCDSHPLSWVARRT